MKLTPSHCLLIDNTLPAVTACVPSSLGEEVAMHQIYQAAKLPISVAGAWMPGAHSGYGLPVGGVLATENVVIPL